MNEVQCPVCLSIDGYICSSKPYASHDATLFECEVCGAFAISGSALEDGLLRNENWSKVQRAALSHNLRISSGRALEVRLLTTYDLNDVIADSMRLPSPAEQSINIIRFIGDRVTGSGSPVESLGPEFSAEIGSADRSFALSLLQQLDQYGLITAMSAPDLNNPVQYYEVSLTLAGWEKYEAERAGQIAGTFGFIALKFNDPILDPLLNDYVKPAIRNLGFDAVDMRDVAEAGIIDNLMRVRIRDCAFLIADLTHESAGAYWEAGYAEGLGKPVLYICEKGKFEAKQTHFDTNHCTTVLWDVSGIEPFVENLIATLRRSLAI